MPLSANLKAEVASILDELWETQTTSTTPAPEELRLNKNHAKYLEQATVLYADLDGSTNMVDNLPWWYSAEIYKTYLRCAAAIIRSEQGSITAYDGDRVMAVFTGNAKNTSAVRAALKINCAVIDIIRPAIKVNRFGHNDFTLNHVVGVDTSHLHAARIGVRGDNDIVWVGPAANHAAKLTNLSGKPIWITRAVYDNMNDGVKYYLGNDMWEKRLWTSMNNKEVYCTTYMHTFD